MSSLPGLCRPLALSVSHYSLSSINCLSLAFHTLVSLLFCRFSVNLFNFPHWASNSIYFSLLFQWSSHSLLCSSVASSSAVLSIFFCPSSSVILSIFLSPSILPSFSFWITLIESLISLSLQSLLDSWCLFLHCALIWSFISFYLSFFLFPPPPPPPYLLAEQIFMLLTTPTDHHFSPLPVHPPTTLSLHWSPVIRALLFNPPSHLLIDLCLCRRSVFSFLLAVSPPTLANSFDQNICEKTNTPNMFRNNITRLSFHLQNTDSVKLVQHWKPAHINRGKTGSYGERAHSSLCKTSCFVTMTLIVTSLMNMNHCVAFN